MSQTNKIHRLYVTCYITYRRQTGSNPENKNSATQGKQHIIKKSKQATVAKAKYA